MGGNAGRNATASRRCAVAARCMHQIASICSPKIVVHQYYWAVSPAWLCFAGVRRDSAVSIPSLPSSGVVLEVEVDSTSVILME